MLSGVVSSWLVLKAFVPDLFTCVALLRERGKRVKGGGGRGGGKGRRGKGRGLFSLR